MNKFANLAAASTIIVHIAGGFELRVRKALRNPIKDVAVLAIAQYAHATLRLGRASMAMAPQTCKIFCNAGKAMGLLI